MALTARPIDPRDITWEEHRPVFRVYLYTPPSWSAAEWELTGADITDVLAWADADTPTGGVAEVSVVVRLTRLRSSAKSGCAATTRTQAILLAVR